MYYTSVADADLNSSEAELDRYKSGPDKELRNSKRGAFLLITLLVLMVAFTVWVRVRPDMSTYDGTVALIAVLTVVFLLVLSMLAFVLLKLKHILGSLEDLQETILDIDDRVPRPMPIAPDDDIFSGD